MRKEVNGVKIAVIDTPCNSDFRYTSKSKSFEDSESKRETINVRTYKIPSRYIF